MERDPCYLFNNSMAQITPDCCQFLEELANCIAPDFGRSREKREKRLGTGVSTRLVFVSDRERDIRKPLDVTKVAMVAQSCLKRGGNSRRCCTDGLARCCQLINRRRRTASSTWSTLPEDNGMSSITMSRARITHLKRRLRHWTLLTSRLARTSKAGMGEGREDSDEISIPSTDLTRERARVDTNVLSFNRRLNAGIVDRWNQSSGWGWQDDYSSRSGRRARWNRSQ